MQSWQQDLMYTFRRLAKSPGFVLAVVVSIGLGIAANATIFSMVSKFVLRPAPVGDPARLLAVLTTERGECCNRFTGPLFTDVREQAKSFSGVAGYFDFLPASMGGHGEPERVWGQAVTSNFFEVAQLGMTLGRGFSSDEERLPVVVLGYGLWQRRFAADPAVAGKTVTLSGRPFTVVGVAPRLFRGLEFPLQPEFWVPLGKLDDLQPGTTDFQSRSNHWITVVGRLAPAVTPVQAAAELQVLAQRSAQAHPETEKDLGFRLAPAGSLPPRFKSLVLMFLSALTAVVLLVLAIACANAANLFLAQATGRRREMAVRLALGAPRGRLVRQMLLESVLLALGGGLAGIAVSLWATQALSAFELPAPAPLDLSLGVDWRVLLYTFALSLAAGLLFGLPPAWAASRAGLSSSLKGEEALAGPGRRWGLRNFLVVSQIAMSLVLLCATGLFLRSLENASRLDIGFRSRGLLMMSVDPRLHGYSPERTAQFLSEVQQRVSALPGVASAAWTDVAPLSGGHRSEGFAAEGQPAPLQPMPSTDLYMVTPGYFETMGVPRLAGRDVGNENATGPKVAVVSEDFARRLFRNENPIGRRVSGGDATYEIIGVVKNIKSRTLGEDVRPVLYRSLDQSLGSNPSLMGYTLLVRSSGDAVAVAQAVRREVTSLDPTMAVFSVQTIEAHLRNALFLPRLAGTLFGVFGFLGLLLAAVGLYGVMSYSVGRRTHEIGIRMALGAQAGAVQRLVIRQGMRLALVATALGLAAALAVARFFAAFLYGIQPYDAVTFTVVPLFLGSVALLACWLPARRAARVDPLAALRHE